MRPGAVDRVERRRDDETGRGGDIRRIRGRRGRVLARRASNNAQD